MDAELLKLKLRKTVVKDKSGPFLTKSLPEMDEKTYNNTILDFNIEHWYEALAGVTPYTEFVEISINDAKLFMSAYEILEIKKETTLPIEISQKLSVIETNLSKVLDKVKGNSDGVFVKTSSRSAKNTSVLNPEFKKIYSSYLKERKVEKNDTNEKLICLLKTGTDLLKISNSKEAIEIFKHSERINSDFEIALKVIDRWRENFVIRQWVPIEVTLEFRCFVIKNKLTAITQYSKMIYVSSLKENYEKISKNLIKFFNENVSNKLAKIYSKYVIDFGFGVESLEKIHVIEVNPFLPTTDSGLFDWGKDREILEGNKTFEFRILDEPLLRGKAALGTLLPEWRAVIEEVDKANNDNDSSSSSSTTITSSS